MTDITEKGFTVSVSYGDDTSKVAYLEYYLNGALTETKTTGIWTPTELEANTEYNITVKSYDNAGNISKESMVTPVKTKSLEETISASTEIGKYVNYKPTNGTYIVESRYSGYTENQTFSTETDLKWRIWTIDNNNLYLISEEHTASLLKLAGFLGYNNGVTLIDNACSSCYSNNSYEGITVRNLKIEDILEVVTVEPDPDCSYGSPHWNYYESSLGVPYVWATYERFSFEQAIENRSKAYSLTTKTSTSLYRPRPINTFWYAGLDSSSYWVNPYYRDLIIDTCPTYLDTSDARLLGIK